MELSFLQAFSLTFLIETAILYLLLRNSKHYTKKQIIFVSFVANALTHPIVWFVFPSLALPFSLASGFGFGYLLQTLFSEMFAFLVEAGVFVLLFPKLPMRQALFLSLICNAVSFLAGLVLTYIF